LLPKHPRRTIKLSFPELYAREEYKILLKYVAVGMGGFLGAMARYALGSYIGSRYGVRFPLGTFIINVSGSFLLGLILALLARTTASAYWRYLIPIGFIGAYTTFSTFEYETLRAIQDGQVMTGLLNVGLSLVVGFIAVWAGATLGQVFV
jgi:CrcB protein